MEKKPAKKPSMKLDKVIHRKEIRREKRVQVRLTKELYDRLHTIAEKKISTDSAIMIESLLLYLKSSEVSPQ
jgi:hypothetical protein